MPEQDDRWPGVPESPNFTMVPNILFDRLMGIVSSAEWLVICYIVRWTWGFNQPKSRVAMSLKQIASGKTGLDRGTGLSTATVKVALRNLQQRGVITVERTYDPVAKVYRPSAYRLVYEGEGVGQNPANPWPESSQPLADSQPTLSQLPANPLAVDQPAIKKGVKKDLKTDPKTVDLSTATPSLDERIQLWSTAIGEAEKTRGNQTRARTLAAQYALDDFTAAKLVDKSATTPQVKAADNPAAYFWRVLEDAMKHAPQARRSLAGSYASRVRR